MTRTITGSLDDIEYHEGPRGGIWAVATVAGVRVHLLPTTYHRVAPTLELIPLGHQVEVMARGAGPQCWVAISVRSVA